jgi:phosphopantetheinyl transferase (holo-ACP synthase)
LDLLRATHQFLLKQFTVTNLKQRQPKLELIPNAAEYLEKAIVYGESNMKLKSLSG